MRTFINIPQTQQPDQDRKILTGRVMVYNESNKM